MSRQNKSEPERDAGLVGKASVVAIFTLVSRVFGYLRDMVIAAQFGAGPVHDAYVVALTIPNALRRLVAEGSLMITYIPLLKEQELVGGKPEMRRFTQAVLAELMPVLALFALAGVLFPGFWVDLFAQGFDSEREQIAESLTRIMMPYAFIISLVAVASGALNASGIFGAPAATPILLNLSMIVLSLYAGIWGDRDIRFVAFGVLLGGLLQFAILIRPLIRIHMLVWPKFNVRHPAMISLRRRMLPAVFGVGVYQLNLMVIRNISSFLPEGDISCYFWATRLEEFALGVFAISISIASLPTLSEHAARQDHVKVRETFLRAIRGTNAITIPAAITLLFFAEPIVFVLFHHGRVSIDAVHSTASIVRIMALGLAQVGMIRVLVPTYYALKDTVTPVGAAFVSLLVTTGFGLWLRRDFGILGLTTATFLGSMSQCACLLLLLKRRMAKTIGVREDKIDHHGTGMRKVLVHAARAFVAAAMAGSLLWAAHQFLDWENNPFRYFVFPVAVLGFGALYLWLCTQLGVEEGQALIETAKRKMKRVLGK